MDEEGFSAVAQLLSGSTGPKLRTTACTTVAACTAGDAGEATRHNLGKSPLGETIVRRLINLTSSPQCGRVALTALVNLSEDESVAAIMIRASAVELCTTNLLDDDESVQANAHLYSGLLSNLTRIPAGVDALVGKGKGTAASNAAIHTLLRLVAHIDRIPQVLWMSNACSRPEGRAALLLRNNNNKDDTNGRSDPLNDDVNRQPLTWLLRLMDSPDYATRLAAASAVRNCAMSEDCHEVLVRRTNAIGICLARLIGLRNHLSMEQVSNAPQEVKALVADPSKIKGEPGVEIRLLIVESLLLLCKSRIGRDALREKDAYLVLVDWNEHEADEQIQAAVTSITGRIAADEEDDQ